MSKTTRLGGWFTGDPAKAAARREKEKDLRIDQRAASIRRYDAKTEARRKAGGAGFQIMFYEKAPPKKKTGGKKRWMRKRSPSTGRRSTSP